MTQGGPRQLNLCVAVMQLNDVGFVLCAVALGCTAPRPDAAAPLSPHPTTPAAAPAASA
jgi:hypothetical protein